MENNNNINYPCDLDQDSVKFIEAHLHDDINPHLETREDYHRAIFYLKACRMQELGLNMENVSPASAKFIKYFDDKEKVDALFSHIYKHAVEFEELTTKISAVIEAGQMPDNELMEQFEKMGMSGAAASTATLNEHLTPALHIQHGDRDVGNMQILQTIRGDSLDAYFAAFPDLDKILDKELANSPVEKRKNHVEQILEKSAGQKARVFPVFGGNNIEDVCKNMTDEANKENADYKATHNGITFIVHAGDTYEQAARAYAEKRYAGDNPKVLFQDLEDISNWGTSNQLVLNMCTRVATEIVATKYPERLAELSPLVLLTAQQLEQGCPNSTATLRIRHALQRSIEEFKSGKDNIPLTLRNMESLKKLKAYDVSMQPQQSGFGDNVWDKRIQETKQKLLQQEMAQFGKKPYMTTKYVALYQLADDLGDKKAKDLIAQTVSPEKILGIHQQEAGNSGISAQRKHLTEKFLLHSLDMYMQGHNNIPATEDGILALKDLRGYIRDICHEDKPGVRKYTHLDIEQRNNALYQRFMDKTLKYDQKTFERMPTASLFLVAEVASNYGKNSKYGNVLKKVETEIGLRHADTSKTK